MKKLFYLFIVAMCATVFTACSKDDDTDPFDTGGEGVITMTIDEEDVYLWIGTAKVGEIITIDWGDGQTKEYKSVKVEYDEGIESEVYVEYDYAQSGTHTIKVTGGVKSLSCGEIGLTSLDVSKCTALIGLYCHHSQLTTLDISKCTALTYLRCYDNQLTSLDVSKCTALTVLDCGHNQLTSTALNKIFTDLPQGKTWNEYGSTQHSSIDMSDNPGSDTCNKSIIENKGWKVVNW